MTKKMLFIPLALLLAASLVAIGCPSPTTTTPPTSAPPTSAPPTTQAPPAKDEIVLGQAIALSGPYTIGAAVTQIAPNDMWIDEVNKDGGLYVEEYGKKLPLRLIRYDDTSDIGTQVKLTEKLILEDKVDFVLGPWSTAMWFAIAPTVNEYKYPVIAPTVDSLQLRDMWEDIPYLFIHLNQPKEKAEAMVDMSLDLGIKTLVAAHAQDLHGIEYAQGVIPQLAAAGVEVLAYKSFPIGVKDLTPMLKEFKSLDPDAMFVFAYPDENFLITAQSIEVGFNPDLFFASIGIAFSPYRDMFGAETVEGVMGAGAWHPSVPYTGAAEFWDRMVAWSGPGGTDWLGNAYCYSAVQVLEQAIVGAGTLDRVKVRDYIASETFDTVIGPVYYEKQLNMQVPGHVGQWQNGEFHIVAAKELATSDIVYPKPPWPSQ